MKNRRIFISINLDENTKKYIAQKLLPLKNRINANWTKPEQFHVTLSFLGFVDDEVVSNICQDLSDTIGEKGPFDLFFDSLELAPSIDRPKMIWLKGRSSKILLETRKIVEQVLAKNINKRKVFEMQPHITLARLKRNQTLSFEQISEDVGGIQVKAPVPVSSIDVMESVNEKGIWKHYFLEQIEL